MEIGKEVNKVDEILEMFSPVEGFNSLYYGQVGNGKTTNLINLKANQIKFQ